MKHTLSDRLGSLKSALLDDRTNKKILCLVCYSVLGAVAIVMTVMNIFTRKGALTYSTAIFGALCLLNVILTLIGPAAMRVSTKLFSVEILVLFTFFLVSGNPEGFSAIWICMLPTFGMLFFGRSRGSLLCFVMFLILAFLLWTPYGSQLLQYDYTSSFRMRFPVLFLAFHALAFVTESLRYFTHEEMVASQERLEALSVRDALTGMYNRPGMYGALETGEAFRRAKKIGIMLADIDNFKAVNDTYGHNAGDFVLKEVASIISSSLNTIVCRWGGEEFVAIYPNGILSLNDLEKMRKQIEAHPFVYGNTVIRLTVSIGVHESDDFDLKHIDRLIECADMAMYQAKSSGKNRIILFKSLSAQNNA